jgi:hypothetical protein
MSRSRSKLGALSLNPAYSPRASMQGAALLALLTPLAFGSCVADSVSLRITCNVVPEGDCTYQESGNCQAKGALNLAVPRSYSAVLRVSNGLKPRNSDVPPQSEPNGIQMYELEVELSDSAGKKISFGSGVPNPYTVPSSGFIEPSEDGLIGGDLIPSSYVKRIASLASKGLNQVRLSVIARGKTSGDVEVETGTWNWAIELGAFSVTEAEGMCVAREEDVCQLGQDSDFASCNPATVE